MSIWQKTGRSISVIFDAIHWFLVEIYFYYTNLYPIFILIHIFWGTNRKLRLIWIVKNRGRKPLDEFLRSLIIEMKTLNRASSKGWRVQWETVPPGKKPEAP